MRLVVSDHTSFPEYDAFEQRISTYSNNAYFESLCSDDQSTDWLLDFVDTHCPERMGQESCTLSAKAKETCDTSCDAINYDGATTYDLMMCCPSWDLCNEGKLVSCPYHRCRVEILEELLRWAGPTKIVAQGVIILSGVMLFLVLLLICFNPRDEIEVELLKTGVMSVEDVMAIRKLKENANVVTKRDAKIDVERLDDLKNEQNKGMFGGFYSRNSRKRLTRISPTNID